MSKKKARLIGCNDRRYTQYYNIYRNKFIIQNPKLASDQIAKNVKERHFKNQSNSEQYDAIIKNLIVQSNKNLIGYVSFIHPLYRKIYLKGLTGYSFFINESTKKPVTRKMNKASIDMISILLNKSIKIYGKRTLRNNSIWFIYNYKKRRFKYFIPRLNLHIEKLETNKLLNYKLSRTKSEYQTFLNPRLFFTKNAK